MVCAKCLKDKKHVANRIPDVTGRVCGNCHWKWAAQNPEWKKHTAERKAKYMQQWRQENSQKVKDQRNKSRQLHPESERRRLLKFHYGMTPEEYNQLFFLQKGLCLICLRPQNNKRQKRLHVDHDHKTGEIRALLCWKCNSLIGLADENLETLERAILYLKLQLPAVIL